MDRPHKENLGGFKVLNNLLSNKGTAFTFEERERLGLIGLLPSAEMTLAVASRVDPNQPGASLLPQMENLRAVSATVAVAKAAEEEGLATVVLENIIEKVQEAMWQPKYPQLGVK